MSCRELHSDDQKEILDLYERNPKLFKKELTGQGKTWAARQLIELLQSKPGKVLAVGCFQESELIGFISATRWGKLPYYTIKNLKIHNPSGNVRTYISVFDKLATFLLQSFEKELRMDFYFLNYQRNFHRSHFQEQLKHRGVPQYLSYAHRYDLSVQEVIEPGQQSRFEAFRELAEFRVHDVPVWIRRGSLKEEFRNELLLRKHEGSSQSDMAFTDSAVLKKVSEG